jgi:hypothetical protein
MHDVTLLQTEITLRELVEEKGRESNELDCTIAQLETQLGEEDHQVSKSYRTLTHIILSRLSSWNLLFSPHKAK